MFDVCEHSFSRFYQSRSVYNMRFMRGLCLTRRGIMCGSLTSNGIAIGTVSYKRIEPSSGNAIRGTTTTIHTICLVCIVIGLCVAYDDGTHYAGFIDSILCTNWQLQTFQPYSLATGSLFQMALVLAGKYNSRTYLVHNTTTIQRT